LSGGGALFAIAIMAFSLRIFVGVFVFMSLSGRAILREQLRLFLRAIVVVVVIAHDWSYDSCCDRLLVNCTLIVLRSLSIASELSVLFEKLLFL
jgi:hypothetical protein